jgi:hypothetical protein
MGIDIFHWYGLRMVKPDRFVPVAIPTHRTSPVSHQTGYIVSLHLALLMCVRRINLVYLKGK